MVTVMWSNQLYTRKVNISIKYTHYKTQTLSQNESLMERVSTHMSIQVNTSMTNM